MEKDNIKIVEEAEDVPGSKSEDVLCFVYALVEPSPCPRPPSSQISGSLNIEFHFFEKLLLNSIFNITARLRYCCRCKKQKKQYACPRCSLPYCSLACYKGHGSTCTEGFYQENVFETLQSMKTTSDDDKNKMAEILKRVYESDQQEKEERELYEKISEMDLDDPNLFEKLSKEDQETFMKLLKSGQAGTFIEPWVPWWSAPSSPTSDKQPKPSVVIEDLSGDDTNLEKEKSDDDDISGDEVDISIPPEILDEIPAVSSLMKKAPSPLLPFHIVNVLYSYAYSLRLFNGDLMDDIDGAVSVLMDASVVLNGGTTPLNNTMEAIGEALLSIQKGHFTAKYSKNFSIAVIQDVSMILVEKKFVLSSFSELVRFFMAAAEEAKASKAKNATKQHSLLAALSKKMIFFLAYVNEMTSEQLDELANEVLAQHRLHFENAAAADGERVSKPTNPEISGERPKKIIEEVS